MSIRWFLRMLFVITAYIPIVVLFGASSFVFLSGFPVLVSKEFYSVDWFSLNNNYGFISLLIGSITVTILSLLISVPLSLSSAILISQYLSQKRVKNSFQFLVFIFAGIPPIVYGFWGLTYFVPIVRLLSDGPGYSVLATVLTLAMMEIPTLILAFQSALDSVPVDYKEAALATSGANKLEAIFLIIIPISKPGIIAGIILGIGRALGETTAVLLTSGNVAQIPLSIFSPIRTITANIALELGESTGSHRQAIYATGVILLVLLLLLNGLLNKLNRGESFDKI